MGQFHAGNERRLASATTLEHHRNCTCYDWQLANISDIDRNTNSALLEKGYYYSTSLAYSSLGERERRETVAKGHTRQGMGMRTQLLMLLACMWSDFCRNQLINCGGNCCRILLVIIAACSEHDDETERILHLVGQSQQAFDS
jgi:hypothetical protein